MLHQQRCSGQSTLEPQDLPCTYLAHHELQSATIIIISTVVVESVGPIMDTTFVILLAGSLKTLRKEKFEPLTWT